MNSIVITGRLTADPDVRYTNSQMAVVKFTVAVDRFKGGEKKTDFIPCVAFGKQGEFVEKWFTKGKGVEVVGSLQTDTYEKDGQKHKSFNIVVDKVSFALENNRGGGGNENRTQSAKSDDIPKGFSQLDMDIPF